MAAGTHDTGEEWKQKTLFRQDLIGSRNASVFVGLYDDSTDRLTESDDVGAITTEPTTGNYAQQAVSLDSSDFSLSQDANSDLAAEYTVTFDVTDTTETVDAAFVVVNFQSDIVNSETSANNHLLASVALGSTKDLSTRSSLDVTITDALS